MPVRFNAGFPIFFIPEKTKSHSELDSGFVAEFEQNRLKKNGFYFVPKLEILCLKA